MPDSSPPVNLAIVEDLRMTAAASGIRYVQVMRDRFGPFDGAIIGETLAYTFVWTDQQQDPPFTHHERVFVLLDVGAQLSNPPGFQGGPDSGSWYIDLVIVEQAGDQVTIRDHDIDVIVSTDGRGYRLIDMEEYAEAFENGECTLDELLDGLKRWQAFLDRHLHGPTHHPVQPWPDFPPKSLEPFAAMESLRTPDASTAQEADTEVGPCRNNYPWQR
jgi:hypothetical protein